MIPPKIIVILFLLNFTSCVKEVDFDQPNDVSAQPQNVASLIHFNFSESDIPINLLILGTSGVPPIIEKFDIPVASNFQNNDYLDSAFFNFKIKNTFNRDAEFILEFYDVNGNSLGLSIPISIPANNISNPIDILVPININILKRSHSASVSIEIMNGSIITPTIPPQHVNVQVSGIFNFNFHN
jgi:hypothetical protein